MFAITDKAQTTVRSKQHKQSRNNQTDTPNYVRTIIAEGSGCVSSLRAELTNLDSRHSHPA